MGRLIPAHAGKTWICGQTASQAAAHPRSRGENQMSATPTVKGEGSSPLTRGKRPRRHQRGYGLGLIPAHAGKTGPPRRSAGRSRAHPRSRGENRSGLLSATMRTGSSPLTRGKRDLVGIVKVVSRLIPAHAGKTRQSSRNARQRAAHPRSRGENAQCGEHVHGEAGSSPLTRGKRDPAVRRRRAGRLIPAHAGKTRRPTGYGRDCEAHPRSRGENRMACHSGQSGVGSSPLTRGKHADLS